MGWRRTGLAKWADQESVGAVRRYERNQQRKIATYIKAL